MSHTEIAALPPIHVAGRAGARILLQTLVIGLTAFLTFVDLFATQAILPSLVEYYGVSPAAMGFAVNACTIGMAVAGLVIAFAGRRINRRRGIWVSLALLAIPTSLLSVAPDLTAFAVLRVIQGVFMASAFALTMAYLAERSSAREAAGALAAAITGNVASNLFGRLLSASAADHFGLAANFYIFAGLNLAGAALVFFSLSRCTPMASGGMSVESPFRIWLGHLRNPMLARILAIGFIVLFAFIGTFTYVNFVLASEPISLEPMLLGLVYLVFIPSIFTTPVAAKVAGRFGARPTLWASFAVAAAGLPLILVPELVAILAGLVLIGVGTFFAQATATGLVGRAVTADRGAASGMYIASYYLGGMAGSLVLGQVFDGLGWAACVAGIGASFVAAALLIRGIRLA
jgi:MFS transporter, YNFM family, putative membrane transport protein